jgi:hypothetical protein
MSRARELRESNDTQFNLFDLLSLFVPEKKTKYVETIMRVMKNTPNIDGHVDEIKRHFENNFGVKKEHFNGFTNLQMIMAYKFIDSLFNVEDLKKYQRFCEYNERNIIAENDLTTYRSFDQINKAVEMADLIAEEKELEKQIKILYKDSEWICLRPLTIASSRKYGANTKWCTVMEKDDSYFKKYAGKGILIYSINKKSGYKVATYYSLDKTSPEFSFWDVKDQRIDSLETELTQNLIKIIVDEKKTNKPNLQIFEETKSNVGSLLSSLSRTTSRISQAFIRENDERDMEASNETYRAYIDEYELSPIDSMISDDTIGYDEEPVRAHDDHYLDSGLTGIVSVNDLYQTTQRNLNRRIE